MKILTYKPLLWDNMDEYICNKNIKGWIELRRIKARNKKLITMILGVAILIVGGSKVAQADSLGYSFTLPSTGYRTTGDCLKTDDFNFVNHVTYNGRPEYRIDFWGTQNNSRVTTDSYFYGTGTKYAYYGKDPKYYNGTSLYMTIKTGPTTYVEINVDGSFSP